MIRILLEEKIHYREYPAQNEGINLSNNPVEAWIGAMRIPEFHSFT